MTNLPETAGNLPGAIGNLYAEDYKATLKISLQVMERCLKTDYGNLFTSQFKTDEDHDNWKRRIHSKLNGMHPQDILDGYELLTDAKPNSPPKIPEIVEATIRAKKIRLDYEKNQAETARLESLPKKPEISDSVAKENLAKIRDLLGKATAAMERPETGDEKIERLARLKQKTIDHDALLAKDFPGLGKKLITPVQHECGVGWCREIGTRSSSITGNGVFYCKEHYVG
jgi:hypothetical protein